MPAKRATSGRKKQVSRRRSKSSRNLIVRVTAPPTRGRAADARTAAEPDIEEVGITRSGGPVSMEIAFGHAQHGRYTIQLFDTGGNTELAREEGLSTDTMPDRFDLQLTPAQLHRHLLQWSGSVDAFSGAPAQRYSVIFDVVQGGQVVPDGHCVKEGELKGTQAFLGVIRLVTS